MSKISTIILGLILMTAGILLTTLTVPYAIAQNITTTTTITNGQAVNTGYLLNCLQTSFTPNSTQIQHNSTKFLVHSDSNNTFTVNTAYTCTVLTK